MGYTHYWHVSNEIKNLDQKFSVWAEDVRKTLANLPSDVSIAGGDGIGQPEITSDLVSFNGDTKSCHEPFIIKRSDLDTMGFSGYCKTAYSPYDLAVATSLIRLAHWFPEIQVSSDGTCEDWEKAIILCRELFGTGDLPFTQFEFDETQLNINLSPPRDYF